MSGDFTCLRFVIHVSDAAGSTFPKTGRCSRTFTAGREYLTGAVLGEIGIILFHLTSGAHGSEMNYGGRAMRATSVKVFYVTSARRGRKKKNQFRRGNPRRCAAPCTDDLHTWREGIIARTRCTRHSFEFQRSRPVKFNNAAPE